MNHPTENGDLKISFVYNVDWVLLGLFCWELVFILLLFSSNCCWNQDSALEKTHPNSFDTRL